MRIHTKDVRYHITAKSTGCNNYVFDDLADAVARYESMPLHKKPRFGITIEETIKYYDEQGFVEKTVNEIWVKGYGGE